MKLFCKKNEKLLINQPKDTHEIVKLEYIGIPSDFKDTYPKAYKLDRCRRLYEKLGRLDKPLTVYAITNEKGKPSNLVLTDGYTRYLYAEKIGLKMVPVKYI